MFAERYYAPRFFPNRYWPPLGGEIDDTVTASGGLLLPTRVGTSWNPKWAKEYGSEAGKAAETRARVAEESPEAVKDAVSAVAFAEDIDAAFDPAQEIAERIRLSDNLDRIGEDLLVVMSAYYEIQRMAEEEDEQMAIFLLLG